MTSKTANTCRWLRPPRASPALCLAATESVRLAARRGECPVALLPELIAAVAVGTTAAALRGARSRAGVAPLIRRRDVDRQDCCLFLFRAGDREMARFDQDGGPAASPSGRRDRPLRSWMMQRQSRLFALLPDLYAALGGDPTKALETVGATKDAVLTRLDADFARRLVGVDPHEVAASWQSRANFGPLKDLKLYNEQLWIVVASWSDQAGLAEKHSQRLYAWWGPRRPVPTATDAQRRRASELLAERPGD